MSTSSTVGQTARFDRMLRFEDLAIGAGAIPLPVDLSPSAMTQEQEQVATSDGPATDQRAAEPVEVHTPDQPAPVAHTPDPVPEDAVLKSLQAAVDAVHASLHDGPVLQLVPQTLGDVLDATTPHSDDTTFAVPANVPPAAATSDGRGETAAIPHAAPDIVQPATPVLPLANAAEPELHPVHAAEAIVANLSATVASTLNGVVSAATHDAVTIPSLGGLGLDAMAGLLHAPAVAQETHALDTALTSLHDMPVFAAIGVPEVIHADQDLAHAIHSPLHLVGSGII